MKTEYFDPSTILAWIAAANTGDADSISEVQRHWNPEEVSLYQLVILCQILDAVGELPTVDHEQNMLIAYNDDGAGDELRVAYRWEDGVLQSPDYYHADGETPYTGAINAPSNSRSVSVVKAVYRIDGSLTGEASPSIAPYPAEGSTAGRDSLLAPVSGKSLTISYPHHRIDIQILPSTSAHVDTENPAYYTRNGFQYNAGLGDDSLYKTTGRSDIAPGSQLFDQSELIECYGDCALEITVYTTKQILNTIHP